MKTPFTIPKGKTTMTEAEFDELTLNLKGGFQAFRQPRLDDDDDLSNSGSKRKARRRKSSSTWIGSTASFAGDDSDDTSEDDDDVDYKELLKRMRSDVLDDGSFFAPVDGEPLMPPPPPPPELLLYAGDCDIVTMQQQQHNDSNAESTTGQNSPLDLPTARSPQYSKPTVPTDNDVCFGWINHKGTKKWRDEVKKFLDDCNNHPIWSNNIGNQIKSRMLQQEGIQRFLICLCTERYHNKCVGTWFHATDQEILEKTRQRFLDARKRQVPREGDNKRRRGRPPKSKATSDSSFPRSPTAEPSNNASSTHSGGSPLTNSSSSTDSSLKQSPSLSTLSVSSSHTLHSQRDLVSLSAQVNVITIKEPSSYGEREPWYPITKTSVCFGWNHHPATVKWREVVKSYSLICHEWDDTICDHVKVELAEDHFTVFLTFLNAMGEPCMTIEDGLWYPARESEILEQTKRQFLACRQTLAPTTENERTAGYPPPRGHSNSVSFPLVRKTKKSRSESIQGSKSFYHGFSSSLSSRKLTEDGFMKNTTETIDMSNMVCSVTERQQQQEDNDSSLSVWECYERGDMLGQGGFSTVFRATCKRTKETFAIKDILNSKVGPQLVQNEVDVMKVLQGGQHFVRLHDVLEGPDHTYLVMEEIRGGDLSDRLVDKVVYTEHEARKVCKILFEAVDFMHKKKIAHRDLKVENLLLLETGDDTTIKIADFGFAKPVTGLNCLKTMCGTREYVAPELLDLKRCGYDHRVDMWSAGVIVFILLSGFIPFTGTQKDVYDSIRKGAYEFQDKYWSDISSAAKGLIRSMLKVNPDDRITAQDALLCEWLTLAMTDDDDETMMMFSQEQQQQQGWSATQIERKRRLLEVDDEVVRVSQSCTSRRPPNRRQQQQQQQQQQQRRVSFCMTTNTNKTQS